MTDFQVSHLFSASISEYLSGDSIKGISIRDLEKPHENLLALSKAINISLPDLILKNNWYVYNGEYYYFKKMSIAMRVVNELLGEYLSKYMELPTVEYELVLDFNKIVGLLSKNFRNRQKKYYASYEVKRRDLSLFSTAIESHKITDLRKILDRLIMKDFYSCLADRGNNTLISMTFLKKISLEESFDYELSFVDERESTELNLGSEKPKYDTYYNPLFVSKDPDSRYEEITYDILRGMLEYDEYLNEVFERIMVFDIKKALLDLEDAHNFKIADEMKEYYLDFDRLRKDELRIALKR